MPAYHSALNAEGESCRQACGCAVLPIKTKLKGPALPMKEADKDDIIDETLNYFKANVLFRNFEVKGSADRVLVYLTLYTHQCLKRIEKANNKADADKILYQLSQENFTIPGQPGFVLGGFYPTPKSKAEEDLFRGYFKQLREELGLRLTERVFAPAIAPDGKPSKYWMQFTKRKFMNKAFEN